eukprot:11947468-Alexandrium_andersonii.AAC.1
MDFNFENDGAAPFMEEEAVVDDKMDGSGPSTESVGQAKVDDQDEVPEPPQDDNGKTCLCCPAKCANGKFCKVGVGLRSKFRHSSGHTK